MVILSVESSRVLLMMEVRKRRRPLALMMVETPVDLETD